MNPVGKVTELTKRCQIRAEITMYSVLTVEGRKTSEYAIKIQVENLTGKLKPNMPTDVSFG